MTEIDRLQMRLANIRSTAYAATNPANWQKPPNDMKAQWEHWQGVLDDFAGRAMPEWIEQFFSERDRLRASNAGLLEALQSIAANTCCDKCQEAALVARAAIERVAT